MATIDNCEADSKMFNFPEMKSALNLTFLGPRHAPTLGVHATTLNHLAISPLIIELRIEHAVVTKLSLSFGLFTLGKLFVIEIFDVVFVSQRAGHGIRLGHRCLPSWKSWLFIVGKKISGDRHRGPGQKGFEETPTSVVHKLS